MGLSEAQKSRTGLGSIRAQSSKDEVDVAICGEMKLSYSHSCVRCLHQSIALNLDEVNTLEQKCFHPNPKMKYVKR